MSPRPGITRWTRRDSRLKPRRSAGGVRETIPGEQLRNRRIEAQLEGIRRIEARRAKHDRGWATAEPPRRAGEDVGDANRVARRG